MPVVGIIIFIVGVVGLFFVVELFNHREGQKKDKFIDSVSDLERKLSLLCSNMTESEVMACLGKPTLVLTKDNWEKEVGFKRNGTLKKDFFYEVIRGSLLEERYPINSSYYRFNAPKILVYTLGYSSMQQSDPFAYRQTITTSRGGVAVGVYLKKWGYSDVLVIDKIVINHKIAGQY